MAQSTEGDILFALQEWRNIRTCLGYDVMIDVEELGDTAERCVTHLAKWDSSLVAGGEISRPRMDMPIEIFAQYGDWREHSGRRVGCDSSRSDKLEDVSLDACTGFMIHTTFGVVK